MPTPAKRLQETLGDGQPLTPSDPQRLFRLSAPTSAMQREPKAKKNVWRIFSGTVV